MFAPFSHAPSLLLLTLSQAPKSPQATALRRRLPLCIPVGVLGRVRSAPSSPYQSCAGQGCGKYLTPFLFILTYPHLTFPLILSQYRIPSAHSDLNYTVCAHALLLPSLHYLPIQPQSHS